mmetsp:Transcript_2866/g.4161  ORF Transcript_2866/g.4161 Transcript_2866/m.4161 type:complete len:204 (-) Transcript_2866:811-1422(-)
MRLALGLGLRSVIVQVSGSPLFFFRIGCDWFIKLSELRLRGRRGRFRGRGLRWSGERGCGEGDGFGLGTLFLHSLRFRTFRLGTLLLLAVVFLFQGLGAQTFGLPRGSGGSSALGSGRRLWSLEASFPRLLFLSLLFFIRNRDLHIGGRLGLLPILESFMLHFVLLPPRIGVRGSSTARLGQGTGKRGCEERGQGIRGGRRSR